MLHTMKLTASPFEMIQDGRKTIELRLNDDKRQRVQVGDQIAFEHLDDVDKTILVEVLALHYFHSFDELYQTLPLLKCGYTLDTLTTASASDMLSYYSLEQQSQYGVVGIEVRIVD